VGLLQGRALNQAAEGQQLGLSRGCGVLLLDVVVACVRLVVSLCRQEPVLPAGDGQHARGEWFMLSAHACSCCIRIRLRLSLACRTC
jgi:hypothetical protein